MNRNVLFAVAALTLGISGCTTIPMDQEANQSVMIENIKGTVSYRERIALPPGARMEIVVSDITLERDQELILSREMSTINPASPPIPFSINVSTINLSDGPLYGLRAFIRQPDGTILFRTNEPYLLNLRSGAVNTGDIPLVRTSPDDLGVVGIPGLQNGEWRVTQIGGDVVPQDSAPIMSFTADGRFQGSTGCNRFNSTYELDGNLLAMTNVATTRRACDAGTMQQERRFLEAISFIEKASLEDGGVLVLSGNGQRLVAVRNQGSNQ